jgi:hypothetical protein
MDGLADADRGRADDVGVSVVAGSGAAGGIDAE